jgi:hypothetical protein
MSQELSPREHDAIKKDTFVLSLLPRPPHWQAVNCELRELMRMAQALTATTVDDDWQAITSTAKVGLLLMLYALRWFHLDSQRLDGLTQSRLPGCLACRLRQQSTGRPAAVAAAVARGHLQRKWVCWM